MSLHRRKHVNNRRQLLMSVTGFLMGLFLVSTGTLTVFLLGGVEWVDARLKPGDLFLGTVVMLLLAAVEEYIFRGLLLRRLSRIINRWLALCISAATFAAVHLANADIMPLGILNIFLGGLVFGISYMLTHSLLHVIFLHFAWNFLQGPILGFPVSGLPFESLLTLEAAKNSMLSGGRFGFEGSLVCTILLSLAFSAGCWLYLQKPHKRSGAAEWKSMEKYQA